MENFNEEIITLVIESFDEDITLVRDTLYYLYNTSNDDEMRKSILSWFNDNNYCLKCRSELVKKEYFDIKDDEEDENFKNVFVEVCPNCDFD